MINPDILDLLEDMTEDQLRELNKYIVNKINVRADRVGLDIKSQLMVGSRVSFDPGRKRRGRIFGTVTKINRVKVHIDADKQPWDSVAERWAIKPAHLRIEK